MSTKNIERTQDSAFIYPSDLFLIEITIQYIAWWSYLPLPGVVLSIVPTDDPSVLHERFLGINQPFWPTHEQGQKMWSSNKTAWSTFIKQFWNILVVIMIRPNTLTNAGQESGKPDHVGAVRNTGILSIYRCQTLKDLHWVLGNGSPANIWYLMGTARSNAFCKDLPKKERQNKETFTFFKISLKL